MGLEDSTAPYEIAKRMNLVDVGRLGQHQHLKNTTKKGTWSTMPTWPTFFVRFAGTSGLELVGLEDSTAPYTWLVTSYGFQSCATGVFRDRRREAAATGLAPLLRKISAFEMLKKPCIPSVSRKRSQCGAKVFKPFHPGTISPRMTPMRPDQRKRGRRFRGFTPPGSPEKRGSKTFGRACAGSGDPSHNRIQRIGQIFGRYEFLADDFLMPSIQVNSRHLLP